MCHPCVFFRQEQQNCVFFQQHNNSILAVTVAASLSSLLFAVQQYTFVKERLLLSGTWERRVELIASAQFV